MGVVSESSAGLLYCPICVGADGISALKMWLAY